MSGQFKKFDRLTLLKIYGAGSLVGRDQPEASWHMLMEFLKTGTLHNKDKVEDEGDGVQDGGSNHL